MNNFLTCAGFFSICRAIWQGQIMGKWSEGAFWVAFSVLCLVAIVERKVKDR
jgi:hypothetical protein